MPAPPLDLVAIRKQQRRISALMMQQRPPDKLTKYKLRHHPMKVCSKLHCQVCALNGTASELGKLRDGYGALQENRRYRRMFDKSMLYDRTLYVDVGAMNVRGVDARHYRRNGRYFDGPSPQGPPPTASQINEFGYKNLTQSIDENAPKHWRLPAYNNMALHVDSFGLNTSRSRASGLKSRYSSRHTVRFDIDDDSESELDFAMSRTSTMWREGTMGSQTSTMMREGSRFSSRTSPTAAAKYFKEQQLSRANLLNSLQLDGYEATEENMVNPQKQRDRRVKFDLDRNESTFFVEPDMSDNDSDYNLNRGDEDDDVINGSKYRGKNRHKGSGKADWCQCETPMSKSSGRCSSCNTVGYHQGSCEHFNEEDCPVCVECNRKIKGNEGKLTKKKLDYRTYEGMKNVAVGTRRITPPPKTPAKTPTKEQLQRESLWYNRFGVDKEIPADFKLTGFLDALDQYV